MTISIQEISFEELQEYAIQQAVDHLRCHTKRRIHKVTVNRVTKDEFERKAAELLLLSNKLR